ncbi:hypothetical protein MHYP_G00285110 [Metynnis hypsauchen]
MSGEEAPGQERRCFPEILDLVFRLSDGAWRMLLYVANVTQVSQLQFAALSTHTIISAAKSVLQRCVPSLIGPAGMDIVLMEEGLLWKRVESESVSPAGPSTSADSTGPSSSTSAERSSVDQSDGTCDAVEDFLREVMEKSICKLTSSKASPLPGNWKTSSSPLTKEMLNLLEVSPSNSEEDLFAGLESREYLQTKTPKAVEEKIRELKEGADTSSETPESLVAQPVHIVTSRETTANHVSQRDDLAISCTNDAGSETVRDTLENRSTSSQETSSSSSSPLDGREPEVVRKRSRGLRFFGGRKAPFISFGQKKSTKAGPAGVESTNHQADSGNHQSDSGNHQSDSGSQLSCAALQRESTAKPFRKARKRLSRMFSAVRKALPNPCSCMCPPS